MGATTEIAWTDATWNPTRGCSRVSPGCGGAKGEGGCYAERMAVRLSGPGRPYEGLVRVGKQGPRWTGNLVLDAETLAVPLSWRKPRRVFVNSMSDLFHEALTDEQIAAVFGVMAAAPQHTFQVLTKRAERMAAWFEWAVRAGDIAEESLMGSNAASECAIHARACVSRREMSRAYLPWPLPWPLPNVWIGVSVEDQPRAEERTEYLRRVPAAVRWYSAEPLLGPIDRLPLDGISWCVVGGESGPGARPCDVAWIRSIVAQTKAAGVPCFVKQLGANVHTRNDDGLSGDGPDGWPLRDPCEQVEHDLDGTRDGYQGAPVRVHLDSSKGGDPAEWPTDLRVREFPTVTP